MEFKVLRFEDLSLDQLYAILQLRSAIFVVEQDCVYQDLDGLDRDAIHVLGIKEDQLVAYARLLKPGAYYPEPAIGRIVTDPEKRGRSLGKQIVDATIQECRKQFLGENIKIMAQSYLIDFYKSFGFTVTSDEFLEDGIPHVEMLLTA